jgi:hypothetical protein
MTYALTRRSPRARWMLRGQRKLTLAVQRNCEPFGNFWCTNISSSEKKHRQVTAVASSSRYTIFKHKPEASGYPDGVQTLENEEGNVDNL